MIPPDPTVNLSCSSGTQMILCVQLTQHMHVLSSTMGSPVTTYNQYQGKQMVFKQWSAINTDLPQRSQVIVGSVVYRETSDRQTTRQRHQYQVYTTAQTLIPSVQNSTHINIKCTQQHTH